MYQGAKVLSFFRSAPNADWTQQELAEFYRVESALIQAGLSVWTDRGVSDEGDPWFVFGRADNEEVIAHFARIKGQYVVASSVFPSVARGPDFNALIRELLNAHPYVVARNSARRHNVYLHPATLLVALVATAFAKSGELQDHGSASAPADPKDSWWFLHRYEVAIISAIALAGLWSDTQQTEPAAVELASATLPGDVAESDEPAQSASLDPQHDAPRPYEGLERLAGEKAADGGFGIQVWQHQAEAGDAKDAQTEHPVHLAAQSRPEAEAEHADVGSSAQQDPAPSLHQDEAPPTPTEPTTSALAAAVAEATIAAQVTRTDAPADSELAAARTTSSSQPPQPEALRLVNDISSAEPIVLAATSYQDGLAGTLSIFGYTALAQSAFQQDEINITQVSFTDQTAGASAEGGAALDGASSSDLVIRAFIEDFLRDTPDVRIAVFDTNVVIVDADTSHMSDADFGLYTWELSDGSTLSIVGILDDLPHHA